jgi:hypothetical protein
MKKAIVLSIAVLALTVSLAAQTTANEVASGKKMSATAPFIDVVDTDAVAADLFERDFKANPSCSGLNLHIQPQGKHVTDSRAAFRVTFYKDRGWFLAGQSYAGFAGGFAGSLGVERHHAVHMTCTIAKASVHAVLVK